VTDDAAALGAALIDEARRRLVHGFPGQVRECLARLDDGQLWWRPHADSNAVGNLVLHVCGSSRHFLGRVVGGTGYERDRKAEFAAQGPLPQADLLRALEETVAETDRILGALDPARLLELREVPRDSPQSVLGPGAAHLAPLGGPHRPDRLCDEAPHRGRSRRALDEDDAVALRSDFPERE
jgi:hypothetical protein